MSLSLTQLMPDAARATLVAERFAEYEVRAAVFLHQQFGPLMRGLSEAALGRAIGESYALSRQAGLRSEADHLKFLYAVAYWGVGFLTDPQYAVPLIQAGYRPADAARPAYLPIEPVLNALERWQEPLQNELARSQAILRGLLEIAEGPALSGQDLAVRIAAIWPERCRRLSEADLMSIIEAARAEFPAPDAARNGQAVYAAMAPGLGHAFGRDPLLPWTAATAPDGFTLIHGLIDYWKLFGQAVV